MKPVLVLSNRSSGLQPMLTEIRRRLPDFAFEVCSDFDQALQSITLVDFLCVIVSLKATDTGYISFLTRLRKDPTYSNIAVMIYKELPAVEALVSFLESLVRKNSND
jgi:hypothetical protein